MRDSSWIQIYLTLSLIILCGANKCSENPKTISEITRMYSTGEVIASSFAEMNLEKYARYGNNWRKLIKNNTSLKISDEEWNAPLSEGNTTTFMGRTLQAYGARAFNNQQMEYVFAAGPVQYAAILVLLGIAFRKEDSSYGDLILKCVIENPDFSKLVEVMSFSVETSDAEEMLEIFKKNADSPGYINEEINDNLEEVSVETFELRKYIRNIVHNHTLSEHSFDATTNTLFRVWEVYLEGTDIQVPTYQIRVTNDDGDELYVVPGPKDRYVFIVGVIERETDSDDYERNVFFMQYLVYHPDWTRFIVKSETDSSEEFRNKVEALFIENVRLEQIYDKYVHEAIMERMQYVEEWRQLLNINESTLSAKQMKHLSGVKSLVLGEATVPGTEGKIPVFHLQVTTSDKKMIAVAAGPVRWKPTILVVHVDELNGTFTIHSGIVYPQWNSIFGRTCGMEKGESSDVKKGCLNVSQIWKKIFK